MGDLVAVDVQQRPARGRAAGGAIEDPAFAIGNRRRELRRPARPLRRGNDIKLLIGIWYAKFPLKEGNHRLRHHQRVGDFVPLAGSRITGQRN